MKLLKSNRIFQEAFTALGQSWEVSEDLFDSIQRFTCLMYLSSTSTDKVNQLRYELFCVKRGEVESSQLPPCRDSLFMHVLRANYQAAIWRRGLQSQPIIPSPDGHGWRTNSGNGLAIEWMRGSPAPSAVLELLSCRCSRRCKLPDCQCLSNGLKCTDMCKLQTCTNQKVDDEEEVIEPIYEDSETSDDDNPEY